MVTSSQTVIKAYKGFSDNQHPNVGDNALSSFEQNPFMATSIFGSFGAGLYLGDKDCAKSYAESDSGAIYEITVSPTNLLVVHTSDNLIEQFDIDTYSLPLIAIIMDCSLEDAVGYYQEHCINDFYLGAHITTQAVNKGYDAIQVIYNENPNVFELIVLKPSAIQAVSRVS
jgi:hypothetical protein